MTDYNSILAPGKIGAMELKNRMIMTAMGVNTSTPEGFITDADIAYCEERARGGVSLIQLGSATIQSPEVRVAPGEVAISSDEHIPQLRKLADAVHKHGCKLSAQLHHGGRVAVGVSGFMGYPIWCASTPVPYHPETMGTYDELDPDQRALLVDGQFPPLEFKECTREDIARFVELFADGAERAKKAGLDCVEIHGGHGYLLHDFLNPRYNFRTDEYGGSAENRARFYVEIVKAIKERVGDDFPVLCKIDTVEFDVDEAEDGPGITVEQAIQTARFLEAAGADAICCSSYAPSYKVECPAVSHVSFEPNKLVPYAEQIKAAVNIPVTCVGNISIEDASSFIGQGKFDFVQIGRKLLADPELPNKVAKGRMDEARLCLNCYVCLSKMYVAQPVECAINAQCCHEIDRQIEPADTSKRVLIVGGGPAGMEAARVAAMRGHEVTIVEKGDQLGGTAFFASVCTQTNWRLVTYLTRQLELLGVEVICGVEADKAFILSKNPDVVIVATGSKRELPDVPGAKQAHVLDGDTARDMITGAKSGRETGALTKFMTAAGRTLGMLETPEKIAKNSFKWMPLGKNVVLYGGELVGLEFAEFLHARGRNVTLIEPGTFVGDGLALVRRWKMVVELKQLGIPTLVNCKAKSIGKDTFTYEDADGQEHTIAADTVMVCMGAVPNEDLARQLEGSGLEVRCIGDCKDRLSYIEGAIHEGNAVARAL